LPTLDAIALAIAPTASAFDIVRPVKPVSTTPSPGLIARIKIAAAFVDANIAAVQRSLARRRK
jgi:hypothetical protein